MTRPDDLHPDEEFDVRLAHALLNELANPTPPSVLWWCSFVDDVHLGVVIVAAPGPAHAVRRTSVLGVNPGGEVAVVPILARVVPDTYRDRLLTRAETDALNALPGAEEGPTL